MNRELMKQAIDALEWYVEEDDVIEGMEGNERWVEGKRIAESVIEALRTELAKPEPEAVALNWVNLQNAADEIVRNKPTWKRFIDGTPLANDIACWMADFALEYATEPNCKFPHSQEYQDELAKETVPNWSAA